VAVPTVAATVTAPALYATASYVAAGAAAGAVSSLAGQVVGNIVGIQNGLNWKNMALAAIGGGLTAGKGGYTPLPGENVFNNAVINAAIAIAAGQGIGVITGLQRSFSWKCVVAAALGAGVGAEVGTWLGQESRTLLGRVGIGAARSLARSLATGGKINAGQVAVDAFGNALENHLVDNAYPPIQSVETLI
jgi:hypothetical protein